MNQEDEDFESSNTMGPKSKQDLKRSSSVENVKKHQSKKHVMFFTLSEDSFVTSAPLLMSSAESNLWSNPILGTYSKKMTCSNCRHCINTEVDYQSSWRSYAANAATGLCCLPFFYKFFQTGTHQCPLCLVYLGHLGPPVWYVAKCRIKSRNENTTINAICTRTPHKISNDDNTLVQETVAHKEASRHTMTGGNEESRESSAEVR